MNEQSLIFEKYLTVVNEGGAAGHMMHPFDLPDVKNIHDIINVMYSAVEKLNRGKSTIKLDGVNLSLKLVKSDANSYKREFALDRGSQKIIDVNGIRIDTLGERFPEGHGMRAKGKTILEIMNQSIPSTVNELQKLGLWSDPTKFINTEYIDGRENVIDYKGKKIIAFHGINQFVEKRDRKGNVTRPGLKPKPDKKETSRPVNYDEKAMQSFRDKVNMVAQKYGFEVLSGIYVTQKATPNLTASLQEPFSVKYSANETVTQPLQEWATNSIIPKTERVKTKDGRLRGAVSKETYLNVLNSVEENKPLNEIYEEEDIQTAVDGAVTYHLVRQLGQEILRSYTTDDYGHADEHEGIVITDTDYGKDEFGNPNSLKITGDFIVTGMGGMLASNRPENEEDEDDQSAPMPNNGKGMSFSNYIGNPRSWNDPGGTGFRGKNAK